MKKIIGILVMMLLISTVIPAIGTMNETLDLAFPPQSVTITLEDDLDISRGDMIVKEKNTPQIGQDITMMICWLSEKPMNLNGKYGLKHTTRNVRCIIKEVNYKVNINTLAKIYDNNEIELNEIGQITIRTTQPLLYDSYRKNRITGSLILYDEGTNVTVCAGMII